MILARALSFALVLGLLAWVAPAHASVEAEVAFHRGIAAYADGRLEDARQAFQIVVDDDPRDVDALQYLALIAQGQGRPLDAIGFYERVLAEDEDDPDARFDLGTAQLEAGRPEDARKSFEYVLDLEPEHARAHYFAGVAAYRSEQYTDAVGYMDRAVALDPSLRTEASYYTGLAEAYQGNLDVASSAMGVVGQSPQSPLADSAANMQERLQPRPSRRWNLAFTTGAEFDSNPTLAGARSGLNEEQTARFVARLRGSVRVLEIDRFGVSAGYDGYLGVNTEASQVDLQTHVGFLTAGWDLEPVRLNLRYDFAWTAIDLTDSFRFLNRITPTVSVREGNLGLTQAYYQFNHSDFDSTGPRADLSRDGFRHAVGIDQYFFIESIELLRYLRVGVAGDLNDTDGKEFEYRGWEVSGGFGLSLPLGADLTALYRYVRRDYKGRSSFDVAAQGVPQRYRDDHIQLISLDLGVPIGEHWRISAGSSAAFNSSDVGTFDYNRFVTGGYVTYRF